MNRFWIRAVTYGLVIVLGLGAALPSLLPPAWLSALPAAYQSHSLTLGLDLQGGSHLLLKVDTDDLTRGKSGREKAEIRDDAVARSLEVVRRRLNETGVVEPLIVRQGATLHIDRYTRDFRMSEKHGAFLVNDGLMFLTDTRVTAWREADNGPATLRDDGKEFRPFLVSCGVPN